MAAPEDCGTMRTDGLAKRTRSRTRPRSRAGVAERDAGEVPDVSVLLITYNHELYVGRAIDSILMQAGVRLEIIVSEDRSTDATRDIVHSKLAGFQPKRLLLSETNLGSNEVILRAIRAARGRYVSMLDGDDFWLVADKLARQVSVLDSDPTLAACFHNALIVRGSDQDPVNRRWTAPSQSARVGLAELWEGNPFATCAGMLRRDALASVGEWYSAILPMVTDWPLYLACAEQGDIAFVDEAVGAYRLHEHGFYSPVPADGKLHRTARLYKQMSSGLGSAHEQLATRGAARYFTDWMREYGSRKNKRLARIAAWHALRTGGVGAAIGWRRWLRELVRSGL